MNTNAAPEHERSPANSRSRSELTPKQSLFVTEYLRDLNATQAAMRAGYSKRTARKQGSELMEIPKVRQAIDQAKAKRTQRTLVDADFVVERLKLEALGNGPDTSSASRVAALEKLGRHLGMFDDRLRVDHRGISDLTIPAAELTPEQRRQRLEMLEAQAEREKASTP